MPTPRIARDGAVIAGTFVQVLLHYLARRGVDGRQWLPVGDNPGAQLYPLTRWWQFLALSAARLDDPLLGLRLGQELSVRHLGVLGYVMHACGTLGGALQRFQRYERLFFDRDPVRHDIEGDTLLLSWTRQTGTGVDLGDENLIAGLLQCARELSGERLVPVAVTFAHPAPPDAAPYRDYFGCPVYFGQPLTTIRLPLAVLGLPLLRPDAALLQILETRAGDLLAQLPDTGSYERAVRRVIASRLRTGDASLAQVARAMHISARTLRRRLDACGVGFRELVEDTRRRLAEEYLADDRLQLAEIAALLGYAEQSPFQRAFRRWTGVTPQAWRQLHWQQSHGQQSYGRLAMPEG